MAFSSVKALAEADGSQDVSRKELLLRALRLERGSAVDPPARAALTAHVVRGLFLYAPGIILVETIAAILAAIVFWREGSETALIAWLALALATSVLRWLHVLRYFGTRPPAADARRWARLFTFGTLMSGAIWGIGNIAFYAPGNGTLLIVQVFLVTGLSAAALAGYAARLSSFYAFVPPLVLPFGASLALDGIPAHLFTATLLSVWTSILVFLAHLLNQHIADRIKLLDRAMVAEYMQNARDAAVAANEAKTRFLANVSHELRTPLNAIIGFSEIMSSELYGLHSVERYRDYSRDIRNSGTYLLSLINDLLDAAKVEAGRMPLNERVLSVGEIFDQCREQMKFAASTGGIQLTTFVPQDLPSIRVDTLRFRQVLLNLLSNAVKFTPSGGRVSLTASRETNGDMIIRVKDNGIGMRKVEIPRAFEPFSQLEHPTPRSDIGTGLGLTLSRSLIEAHGGQLSLESEVGTGTTATIRIPKQRVVGRACAGPELPRAA